MFRPCLEAYFDVFYVYCQIARLAEARRGGSNGIQMYWTYILKSENYPRSYVGSTDNLKRRFLEHNRGKSRYTSKYLPWKIIYTESFPTLQEARNREKYLKTKTGRKFLKEVVFGNDPS
jgi:putative endonuclease